MRFHRRFFSLVFTLGGLVMLGAAPATAAPTTPFAIEDVDGPIAGYAGSQLAFDKQGNPHIAYRTLLAAAGPLKYATRSGGVWTIETIDASASGPWLGMGVDGQGRVHVAYFDDTGSDLKYALRATGGGWTVEFVDTVGNVGYGASLAVDAQDNPHVCYLNRTTNFAKYATKSGGIWTIENVGFGLNFEGVTSIALDPWGTPHVTFFESLLFGALMYNVRQAGGWGTPVAVAAATYITGNSLAVDAMGFPHVAYSDTAGHSVMYASTMGGGWTSSTVEFFSAFFSYTSLKVDTKGIVHVAYDDPVNQRLRYARVTPGPFGFATIDVQNIAVWGIYPSIAINHANLPAVSFMGGNPGSDFPLRLADSAIRLESPNGGETWPVGSTQTIAWRGAGQINILLSVDGGNSYDVLASKVNDPSGDLSGGAFDIIVPHRPSRFCMVKVERDTVFSVEFSDAVSDSFFTIETSIALLSFVISLDEPLGAVLSWNTDPGPADLRGYRLEKRSTQSDWQTLVPFTKDTSYNDTGGSAGDRYRLYAINGLGEEFYMGETGSAPRLPEKLSLWPVPYVSGDLHVSFATASGLGGGSAHAEVAVYDIAGRLVKRIVSGSYPAGIHTAVWDGRNNHGQRLATGVYFVKATSGGRQQTRKLVIVR